MQRNDRNWPRCWILFVLLAFWCSSLFHLESSPPINQDEPWILSPGYKLWTQGIYGSDLFAGFYGMEQMYLEFMPLFSILQGAVVQVLGIGLFQVRILPVMIAMLTIVTSFVVTRKLTNQPAALLSPLLLLLWQWFPIQGDLGSGIPLVDSSRIARYDILAALLGLFSFWCMIRLCEQGSVWWAALAGMFVALAGLTHIYGLFWGAVTAQLWLFSSWQSGRQKLTVLILHITGFTITFSPWLWIIATHWENYKVQMVTLNPGQFDVGEIRFYLSNLLYERHRYVSGLGDGTAWFRLGVWLVVILIPTAFISLVSTVIRHGERYKRWLLILTITIPGLFALLISAKVYWYLPTLVVIWSISVSWLLERLLNQRMRWQRWLIVTILVLAFAQGAAFIFNTHRRAWAVPSPQVFFAELRQAIPVGERVIGLPQYWFALPETGYRSFVLAFNLASPNLPSALTLEEALEKVAPTYVLLDLPMQDVFINRSHAQAERNTEQFWAFMQRHRAQKIVVLHDHWGLPIEVYRLD